VTFTATVAPPTATQPISYSWGFGDGGTAGDNPAFHNFPISGTYAVALTATNGCSLERVSHDVTVTGEIFTPTYGVELTPPTGSRSGAPGARVVYTLTLRNSGDVGDTFDLRSSGAASWTTGVTPGSASLPSSGTAPIMVTVDIPTGAGDSQQETAIITATSQGSPAVSASSRLTTTARWPRLYLPLLLKRF
jgi:PKD repeat protein